jgi:hypothetical protein
MRNVLLSNSSIALLFSFAVAFPVLQAQAQQAPPVTANSSAANQGIQDMQKVEDGWSEAVTKRDQFGLELALSPQFIGISSTGEVTSRNQQIAKLFIKDDLPLSLERKVISARFINDVAIVNGTYVKHWKASAGPVDEKGIYSHVFEHAHGRWLCINSQETVVAEKTKVLTTGEKKSRSKSSNAELPLHIPLVYKGPSSSQPAPASVSPPS